MNDTEEMIKVMQAYVDGKEIQYQSSDGNWLSATTPSWRWDSIQFRIKPREPRRVWISAHCVTYFIKPIVPETTEFIEVLP